MIHLVGVLNPAELKQLRDAIDSAEFEDGGSTAGAIGKSVKNNLQIKPTPEVREKVFGVIQHAYYRSEQFHNYARPKTMFIDVNRYEEGMKYGNHNDAALVGLFPDHIVRSDLSATLFLADPGSYDGGELVIGTPYGEVPVKLPAGDAIVYPSSTIHRVETVTRGARLASICWIESMVRDEEKRQMLFRLHNIRNRLDADKVDRRHLEEISNVYQNLLRMWAED